jgi:hydroxyethylthiazole kinase-like uncharacterized protein yjeF
MEENKGKILAEPVLNALQIKESDLKTIKVTGITGWQLMERAAKALTKKILELCPDPDIEFLIFCGKGNNGGDGMAIARMLRNEIRNVSVVALYEKGNSEEYAVNMQSVMKLSNVTFQNWKNFEVTLGRKVIIDCVFGFSCNRKPEEPESLAIEWMNHSGFEIISIDVPSGMPVDTIPNWPVVYANYTLNIGPVKMTSLLPETGPAFGKCFQINIGHLTSIYSERRYIINEDMIKSLIKSRQEFSHKGTFGHAAMVAGSKGMMGAAILAVKACLRSGVGLVTSFVPENGYSILQSTTPEAICKLIDFSPSGTYFGKFSAVGIGCGIGTGTDVKKWLKHTLKSTEIPLLLDADALNIIAEEGLTIPAKCVITPHPKEFDRLFGHSNHSLERIEKQIIKAKESGITIVLKGHHTSIVGSDGILFFNSTGNSGMAKGGTGDVLSGLLTGLLAQGYASVDAACLAVYLHGLAGDFAAEKYGKTAMTAGNLIDNIFEAFKKLDQ